MEFAWDRFRRETRDALVAQAGVPTDLVALVTPKPSSGGALADLAFPAFRAGRPADAIAADLTFPAGSLVGGVRAIAQYVNFTVDPVRLAAAVFAEVDRYGLDDVGAGQTVLVEYSSPNVARRMHVGHVRSTIIGQALANINRALGYRVIADNHIGDWGKNFGILITAIQHVGQPSGEGESALARLEQLYAEYNRLTEQDPAIDAEARAWSLKLEQGYPEARSLWRWIVDLTLSVNQRLYDRLGVRFDTVHGESFFQDRMEPIVERALGAGIARCSADGAVVVELAGLPSFLLRRSDGGSLYHTRDAATIAYRVDAYHPSAIVYVVDARQSLHFRQLFALARSLGIDGGADLVHVPFGVVVGPDGQPLAARRGNMVYLETLLDEARSRVRSLMLRLRDDGRSVDLTEAGVDEVAEAVGVGAVIYNDLYQDPKRDISLDWDRMLALNGNSAPYVQMAHARCCSILRRASASLDGDPALLAHPAEIALVKRIARLPDAVREAGSRYAPFVLAEWCYATAEATATFWRDCPVLAASTPELRAARLRLVEATAKSLRVGLGLLGIKAPERM